MSKMTTKRVLMVCLGNICRSPIAEAVFIQIAEEKGLSDKWEVDSAAIGSWHIGKCPDPRATAVLKERNIPYNNKARQIKKEDFLKFDYIFGMDYDNIEDLKARAPPKITAQILLLGDFDPDPNAERVIRDPYYDSDSAGFVKCYEQCLRCCTEFIDKH